MAGRVKRQAVDDDDFGVLLAGGMLLGLSLLAASAVREKNERRREAFRKRLQESLQSRGIVFFSATLGRGPSNVPFWDITTQSATGEVVGSRVPLTATTEPYSEEALTSVVQRVEGELIGKESLPDHG
jgi:hypothetical protein